MEVERINVLGVGISVLDQDRAREVLFEAVREGRRGYVTVTNVYSVSEALRDPALRNIFNRAFLSTPDGIPMVWMGRLQGKRSIRRVYGPDLVLNLCEHSQQTGFSHFFSVASRARQRNWPKPCGNVSRICESPGLFPRLSGRSNFEEQAALAEKVRETS